MTKQEKIIVSAYTGVLMCDFVELHEYIEKKFGRPVFTYELADRGVQKEVEEKSKEEFLEICEREEPERKKGKWIRIGNISRVYKCDKCGNYLDFSGVNAGRGDANFCPNCGVDMRER